MMTRTCPVQRRAMSHLRAFRMDKLPAVHLTQKFLTIRRTSRGNNLQHRQRLQPQPLRTMDPCCRKTSRAALWRSLWFPQGRKHQSWPQDLHPWHSLWIHRYSLLLRGECSRSTRFISTVWSSRKHQQSERQARTPKRLQRATPSPGSLPGAPLTRRLGRLVLRLPPTKASSCQGRSQVHGEHPHKLATLNRAWTLQQAVKACQNRQAHCEGQRTARNAGLHRRA
mmetsp:Transcript_47182/g.109926  ORF Transcript_47182/g.109926 Transcript_47182/m.109926 type:complete len:225 (-) Transcript_47182:1270-1944(-)